MVTSFDALTLEVYYRYLPLFKVESQAPEAAAGMGFVRPAEAAAQ